MEAGRGEGLESRARTRELWRLPPKKPGGGGGAVFAAVAAPASVLLLRPAFRLGGGVSSWL